MVQENCIKQFVQIAVKNVTFLLYLKRDGQSIVEIAMQSTGDTSYLRLLAKIYSNFLFFNLYSNDVDGGRAI